MTVDLSKIFPNTTLMILLIIAVIGGAILKEAKAATRHKDWRNRRRGKWQGGSKVARGPWGQPKTEEKLPDSADQLRLVMAADFAVQPLLNKSETRLFRELDRLVLARHPGWQVMAQVSLGEILRSKSPAAYRCINSKRVDLLVVDAECNAVAAIEYQGGGHYLSDAAARDAVKKEALRKAGIGYHEVVAGHTTPGDLRMLVEKLVPEKTS
ncbi:DUF2726 domain-containing protein [Sphingomonas sp. LY29]|uniref:DUF2726 domain-containing protein n=1 Tax=Sphingomonas sp. LY29 TaxID=3095341 RepID=UPI002D767858|nr:DUF2726 domain-containing protein [Sphingomonas sp. LY29]WRP25143.1 DUF2726 domain-containing protein [Sphingomonas sp. LY29]